MSWTQVHVSGLSQTVHPEDEELEAFLEARYSLASDDTIMWAGPGTTLIKRDESTGACRGYGFLSFHSFQGASLAVEKINSFRGNEVATSTDAHDDDVASASLKNSVGDDCHALQLRAELSKPKKQSKKTSVPGQSADYSDMRLRSQRKVSVRKHPVFMSSDKSKTGLGNKTKS
jgi:RNA recognition motif-containing protein